MAKKKAKKRNKNIEKLGMKRAQKRIKSSKNQLSSPWNDTNFMLGSVLILIILFLVIGVITAINGTLPIGRFIGPPSLVAYYGFDSCSGTIVQDYSGYNNHGTVYGATWSSGYFNKSLSFNQSYVSVPHSSSIGITNTNGITIQAWVYPTAIAADMAIVSKIKYDWAESMGYELRLINGKPAFTLAYYGENWGKTLQSLSSIPLNQWTHVAATYDGYYMKIYVNGAQYVSAVRANRIIGSNTHPLTIGKRTESTITAYFNGKIDEVKLYNHARTAAQIKADAIANSYTSSC